MTRPLCTCSACTGSRRASAASSWDMVQRVRAELREREASASWWIEVGVIVAVGLVTGWAFGTWVLA